MNHEHYEPVSLNSRPGDFMYYLTHTPTFVEVVEVKPSKYARTQVQRLADTRKRYADILSSRWIDAKEVMEKLGLKHRPHVNERMNMLVDEGLAIRKYVHCGRGITKVFFKLAEAA